VKLGKTASNTCAMLSEAYGGESMKKSHVSERHKWFKEGCKNMQKLITWNNVESVHRKRPKLWPSN